MCLSVSVSTMRCTSGGPCAAWPFVGFLKSVVDAAGWSLLTRIAARKGSSNRRFQWGLRGRPGRLEICSGLHLLSLSSFALSRFGFERSHLLKIEALPDYDGRSCDPARMPVSSSIADGYLVAMLSLCCFGLREAN